MKVIQVAMNVTLGFFVLALLQVIGCAGPKPVLYPNDHFKEVGEERAEQDIADCCELADEHISSNPGTQIATDTLLGAGVGSTTGAVGGAVSGNAGRGAAIGAATGATAGFLRGLFRSSRPNRTYMNYVNRCLKERGYEPTGWD